MHVRATFLVATAACLSLATSGCVIEPLEGDSIADRHTDNFDFFGFAYAPGEHVQIQARNKDGAWVTIRHAWAENWFINWNGIKLYYWSADATHIPHYPVHRYWQPISDPDFMHVCEVRVIDSDGYAFLTFNENYPGLWDASSMTLYDLVVAGATNGDVLRLYSEN